MKIRAQLRIAMAALEEIHFASNAPHQIQQIAGRAKEQIAALDRQAARVKEEQQKRRRAK